MRHRVGLRSKHNHKYEISSKKGYLKFETIHLDKATYSTNGLIHFLSYLFQINSTQFPLPLLPIICIYFNYGRNCYFQFTLIVVVATAVKSNLHSSQFRCELRFKFIAILLILIATPKFSSLKLSICFTSLQFTIHWKDPFLGKVIAKKQELFLRMQISIASFHE